MLCDGLTFRMSHLETDRIYAGRWILWSGLNSKRLVDWWHVLRCKDTTMSGCVQYTAAWMHALRSVDILAGYQSHQRCCYISNRMSCGPLSIGCVSSCPLGV